MHTAELVLSSRTLTNVQRWLALIDQHGGQNAALFALFKQVDEFERLKGAVRARGLSPEILASEVHVHGADL